MRQGEKLHVKGKGGPNRPSCPELIPQSIQTHVLPDVKKPDPPKHKPWITMRELDEILKD